MAEEYPEEYPDDIVLSDEEKVDPMTPVYFFIIYFSIFTIFGFVCSFISESSARRQRRSSSSLCATWFDNMGEWREYYHSFALHVLDEATSISAIISMYCVCEDLYGTDLSDWKLITRQPKPGMLLLLSTIIWLLYKLGSLLYLITIDIFSWLQVFLHLLDCNYLYEMYIAHSQKNKNPIIQWMHRQYIYFCSIPLWFLSFVFLLRWSDLFGSTNNPLFVCILLSNLFGLLNIFYVLLWCDMKSFTDECKRLTSRGFRLRFAYRGCQFISRMVWYAYFWIFLGSAPFFILSLIMFLNHIYLYFRGYLGEIYYIITKFFIIPDMSIGIGYRNSANHKKVDWITKIIYILTHCAGCIIGVWVIAEEDLLYIDMLAWLHWFEDLIIWAVITGICDQQPTQDIDDTIMAPPNLWDKIWSEPRYEAFYALGIITWFFGGSYYLVLRIEDFIDRNKRSLSITQGILGLAESGQWDSLDKFLPRMKKISINRKNILDGNKTAIHYAIAQDKWKIIKKLMEYGANVNIQDRNHQTGVHLVCLNKTLNDITIFKKFLNAFDGDPAMKRDNNGKTLLHLICQNNSNNLPLEDRLKCYFEVFGKEKDKDEKKEIDVNIADNDGCTPLHYLSQECNEQNAIELLIEYGANINSVDNKQRTALIHAVSKNENNPTTVRYLLSNGANIDHQDDKGWTPLHFAVSSNLTDNVFILLEYFPNITIRNNAGKNAYNLADSMGYTTIADTLKMNMPIEELIEIDPIEMKERLENERKQREREREKEREKNQTIITTQNGDNKQEEEEEEEVVIDIEEENKDKKVENDQEEKEILLESQENVTKKEDNPLLSNENKGDNEEDRTATIDIKDDDDDDDDKKPVHKQSIDESLVNKVSQHIDLADETLEAYQD